MITFVVSLLSIHSFASVALAQQTPDPSYEMRKEFAVKQVLKLFPELYQRNEEGRLQGAKKLLGNYFDQLPVIAESDIPRVLKSKLKKARKFLALRELAEKELAKTSVANAEARDILIVRRDRLGEAAMTNLIEGCMLPYRSIRINMFENIGRKSTQLAQSWGVPALVSFAGFAFLYKDVFVPETLFTTFYSYYLAAVAGGVAKVAMNYIEKADLDLIRALD